MKLTDALMIASTTGLWAVWPIFVRKAGEGSNPITSSLMIGLCGALVLPTLYFVATRNGVQVHMTWHALTWAFGAYLINILAQLALQKAMQRVPTGTVIGLTNTYPVLTLLFCLLILHEKITLYKAIGMVLIVAGTFFLI